MASRLTDGVQGSNDRVFHPDDINPAVKKAEYAVRGELHLRAVELERQGKEIVHVNGALASGWAFARLSQSPNSPCAAPHTDLARAAAYLSLPRPCVLASRAARSGFGSGGARAHAPLAPDHA